MKCPKCGYEQEDGATECYACGVIFAKLEAKKAKEEADARQKEEEPAAEQKKEPDVINQPPPDKDVQKEAEIRPSFMELLLAAFKADIITETFILVGLVTAYWLISVGMGFISLMLRSQIVFFIAVVVMFFHAVSVMAGRCFYFISATEKNQSDFTPHRDSKLKDLGSFIVVYLISVAPWLLGFTVLIIAGLTSSPGGGIAGLIIFFFSSAWTTLYLPMGLGAVGVYDTLNPVFVVKSIIVTIKWYLVAWIMLVFFGSIIGGIIFLMFMIMGGAAIILSSLSTFSLISIIFIVVMTFFSFYITIVMWAYIGIILKWHRKDLLNKN